MQVCGKELKKLDDPDRKGCAVLLLDEAVERDGHEDEEGQKKTKEEKKKAAVEMCQRRINGFVGN